MANNRKSLDLLPAFFRTERNNKFLSSTLDQLTSPPELTRIDAFVGSKNTPNYNLSDLYIEESNPIREAYQLEPALVVRTLTGEIKKAFALDDLLNQVSMQGGNSSNLNRSFSPKFYSYDPNIDWDKFINFREYYWLPLGPDAVPVSGSVRSTVTEISVTDATDDVQFLFDDLTPTKQLTLYRGTTYVFNVKSKHNFYIKNTTTIGPLDQYGLGITNNGTNNGQITFVVDWQVPNRLYYTSNDNQYSTGMIVIKEASENSSINVEEEILGKQNYTSGNNVKFINGLKISFTGSVFPEKYRDTQYIIEGVGHSIKLIKFADLDTPDSIADLYNARFDGTNFDDFPFDNFKNIPLVPEYITINRASTDLNPWSRYNRWIHSDVIRAVANINNTPAIYPNEYRAQRPIVEFQPDLQLYNFGSTAIPNVALVDNTITDVFYKIENQLGFYIDNVLLEEGYRVIFNADVDPLVRGKIFKVHFAIVNGVQKIDLIPEEDVIVPGSVALITQGTLHGGSSWYFDGTMWIEGQKRTYRNQPPLFDLFDKDGYSYSGSNYASNFKGNKIFGYGIGSGSKDTVLGFPLLYRNVGVEGTYLFKNYFAIDEFLIVSNTVTKVVTTAQTFFKKSGNLINSWVDAEDYEVPSTNGIFEVPVNVTNNPLNGPIAEFTLTELSDHVQSMVARSPEFEGVFPGVGNIKDIFNISRYGTRLISNVNPAGFAHHFITDKENNLIDATRLVGEHYAQFRLNLIKFISTYDQSASPADALDNVLQLINQNKTTTFPYYYSDMLPAGTGAIIRNYKVTDSRNVKYGLPDTVDITTLSNRGLLVYLNDTQLLINIDYTLDRYDANVEILTPLVRGDNITVKFYSNTTGVFVPPTPTKLGLYPKFEPKLYLDGSFSKDAKYVIQGHDGSVTIAFGDYRDQVLLEYEKRVFNNIKVEYRQDLFDITTVMPGVFRTPEFSYAELINPIHSDFLKWKTTYGVDADTNLTFNIDQHKSYNYSNVALTDGRKLPGNWRAIFKMYFDTDRPHTHPWEMLGFYIKPSWWEDTYGPAPYTSGNNILWEDLENGFIRNGSRTGIDTVYARPGLSNYIPVDDNGDLLEIRFWGILGEQGSLTNADGSWKFGDSGPAESAWRRSVYWPFAVQIMMASAKPVFYSAALFDTSRFIKNVAGHYVYSEDNLFLSQSRVLVPYSIVNDHPVLTSGYSVFVVEAGLIKTSNYVDQLKVELTNSTFNLMNKVGGFVSKDKLEIVIDSVNPNSINPGILLPAEDFAIHFNVSNPVDTVNISGIIIQKYKGEFVLRGYDKTHPVFTIYEPIHQNSDISITVGGISEDYVSWSTNVFYSVGQVVYYDNIFYRSTNNHNSGLSFKSTNYSKLLELPIVNATTVQYSSVYESIPIDIQYGASYKTLQEVSDVIAGYGQYLSSKGFIFDGYDADLGENLDWKLTIKEFIYWATQNWADNSVITLSPFANTLKFKFQYSVLDDIFSSFYNYSILKSDGYGFPQNELSISRADGTCTISSKNKTEGIFFASLRLVQKEHALIFNNYSRFSDTIYDIETGYRQRRIKLIGFRTANWNGDFFSPGFIYDSATIQTWKSYEDYLAGDIVEYAGNYYSLDRNLPGKEKFDFTNWVKLGNKPVAQLIPNFEYKINQFEDFYSLDIDNFDVSQQQLAQRLTGYSSRIYLNNIFFNSIAQYKFFQGFIKEKGTKNALDKLARASVHNLQGKINFNEEWAFRIGSFGAYSSLTEIEFPLAEYKFVDNSQIIKFVDDAPVIEYDPTAYITPADLTITPNDYLPGSTFLTTFNPYNITPFSLPVAGYARLDDVDYSVKDKSDLTNYVPGGLINVGDTFWIAYDDNNDWGVYRYARLNCAVISVSDDIPRTTMMFETNRYHGLVVGDIIAVSRFSTEVDGVYTIKEIPLLNQFIVSTTKAAPANYNDFGSLFRFLPSRFSKFDDLADAILPDNFITGKKVWIDSNESGRWEVYEKINNYTSSILPNGIIENLPGYGSSIVSKETSTLVLISAPNSSDDNNVGRVFVCRNNDTGKLTPLFSYSINSAINQYYNNTGGSPALVGNGLDYDPDDTILVVGAPYASEVKSDPSGITRFVKEENSPSGIANEGMIVISTILPNGISENLDLRLMVSSTEPSENQLFGFSIFLGSTYRTEVDEVTGDTTNYKRLLVGAPGHNDGSGTVFSYDVIYTYSFDNLTTSLDVVATPTFDISPPGDPIDTGMRFGEKIVGNKTGTRILVSAPHDITNIGESDHGGHVLAYELNTDTDQYDQADSITWESPAPVDAGVTNDSEFAYDISIDDSGTFIFVSAPGTIDRVLERGKVFIYKWTSTGIAFHQLISNPSSTPGTKFGHSIEADAAGNIVTITSMGDNYFSGVTFDSGATTFDAEATIFGDLIRDVGTAYVYNRYQEKFVFSAELFDTSVKANSEYGWAVSTNRNAIYVSALNYEKVTGTKSGAVHVWNAIDPSINSWKLSRIQDDLVDVQKIKQVKTIDTFHNTVKDYVEIFDPIKGKIPVLADQELRYKTSFDPAVYNTGTERTIVIDNNTAWKSEHVGELWWDLSSVKYVWYEQGDVEYRKNNWGSIFPGCSIDVYEWVSSVHLPSVWADDADTQAGLAASISGRPKFILNTAYSVEQVYSPVTNLYTNIYYYWVSNSVIIPDRQGRTISASDVAGLISNPKLYDLKYIEPLSKNSLSITNVKDSLINERISLNIYSDEIDNENNKHTEWLLLEEGSPHSLPNELLEKKMIDSLLGHDSLGNAVPDPILSDRQRYGIEIRPRQSMFKDRISALRNFVEYANSIFADNLITDYYSFDTLISQDLIPENSSGVFDVIVDDIDARNEIYVKSIQAKLSCSLVNGRITVVSIDNPGYGYGKLDPYTYGENGDVLTWRGPVVEIFNDSNGAKIETFIDLEGKIVSTIIVESGNGYLEAPDLYVRPFTVLVASDINSRGLWAAYSLLDNTWTKVQTQNYNTNLYWDRVDWLSKDFNPYRIITATVEQTYQLSEYVLDVGDYIKVNNVGSGRYIILRKTTGTGGTFNSDFDVMYSQNGTIKINSKIWEYSLSQLGFDQVSPYDNTFFDQTPDVELEKIIYALRDDLFVGTLKVYWNKVFFACVKYALTEQKYLDWAFKTSFISVHNNAGILDQRSVYKFQDTQWYEDYLNEIKPYHTQIRNYQLVYNVVEPTQTFTTDFDLPLVYDTNSSKYISLSETNSNLLNTYPYKGWYSNRTLYVGSIVIDDQGLGYVGVPEVQIISSFNDTIVRSATATAILAGGKIIRVDVTDPGEGYTENPLVLIVGGGVSAGGTVARASARMANGKVRANTVGLKFDRIARSSQVGSKDVTDTFTANGVQTEFVLTWPATIDKTEIKLTINGIIVATSNFEVVEFTSNEFGYTKTYTKILLNYSPNKDSIVKVLYPKSINIYSAYDRISDYFDVVPKESPGANPNEKYAQLMKGMEYPGTEIVTEQFSYDYTWGSIPYGTAKWDQTGLLETDIDSIIDGGDITTSTSGVFSSASGISPSDIILDGDTFISPIRSYAPEELVPGETKESVGFSLFTRSSNGSAMVYTQFYNALAFQDQTITMSLTPPSVGSITLTYDKVLLAQFIDYTIDFSTNTIKLFGREFSGVVAITYVDIGGTGFISLDHAVTEGATSAAVFGNCLYDQVKSVYVTVDGARVYPPNSFVLQNIYYTLTPSSDTDQRAKVTVFGLGTEGKKTISAAFFTSPFKGFSEIYEQRIQDATGGDREITLIQPPGNLGPASANSIVEVNRRRITPPNTTYYEINDTEQTVFDISIKKIYPTNTFDKTTIVVYKNGITVPKEIYFIDDVNNQIVLPTNFTSLGDVLAITALIDYEYVINGDKLLITNKVDLIPPNYVRILTFTNQDASLIRTEVYPANSSRLYKLSRPIVNDNFVWMSIGGKTLTSGIDFEILDDKITIQVDINVPYIDSDEAIITSFSENVAGKTTGIRIFRDVVGRTHYKTLSRNETTYLTEPLQLTDTEISVSNGDVLPPPTSTHPGIILIAGERIEYLEKVGNVLSNIKRATLGTGAKDYYGIGTWVIDQGKRQTIPVQQSINSLSVYSASDTVAIPGTAFILTPTAQFHDQLEVYYGGRLLEKPTAPGVNRYYHDASLSYDPVNTSILDPEFTITADGSDYVLNLNFTPSDQIEIKMIQKTEVSENLQILTRDGAKEAILPDNLYYGGDQLLRLDDGTILTLDDGRGLKGF